MLKTSLQIAYPRPGDRQTHWFRPIPEPYQAIDPLDPQVAFWRDYWHDQGQAYRPLQWAGWSARQ